MTDKCVLRITDAHFCRLTDHLFPGDGDEHGAILLAGTSERDGQLTLQVSEVHPAREGVDYVAGKVGYRALTPQFIHRLITRARDERLAYLAVHNHWPGTSVGFSGIDLSSHESGYPALLQIARGMPVGALVSGGKSLEADVWLADGRRLTLNHAVVVGNSIRSIFPSPPPSDSPGVHNAFDRQVQMFGARGQRRLATCRVAIVGLGGVGSIVAEYLARLGVKNFLLIDPDIVEVSNLSRIVGATAEDSTNQSLKTGVAARMIQQTSPDAAIVTVNDDVAKGSVARLLTTCDYLFLAADSMRARLVVNAVVNQYLIPGVQIGAKVRSQGGRLVEVMSVNRPMRPGSSCLWCNQFIDPNQLATEAKSDEERREQAYGIQETNPSVITLNAVAASTAVNDFMLDYLALRNDDGKVFYQHFHHLRRHLSLVEPRVDKACPECGPGELRFGRADSTPLPTLEG